MPLIIAENANFEITLQKFERKCALRSNMVFERALTSVTRGKFDDDSQVRPLNKSRNTSNP